MNASVYKTALLGCRLGLWIVPPKQDGSKAPDTLSWRASGSVRPLEGQIDRWYLEEHHDGVGVVCGAASGNLEAIDFDAAESYDEFRRTMAELGWADLAERIEEGYLERSPGGVHWLYRCDEIAGNTKLARRPKTPDEQRDPKDTVKTLIETRGEGGYIILAPSHGAVHDTGKPYTLERGSLKTITTISPDERERILSLAKTFDQMPLPDAPRRPAVSAAAAGGRPGDDFLVRGTWEEILLPHGWHPLRTQGGETYWRRPGKDKGQSATTNYHGSDLLYVFSSSTDFDTERGYSKFSAYAILEHNSDWGAAAGALKRLGYGVTEPAGRIHLNGTAKGVAEEEAVALPEIYADEQDLRIITGQAWEAIEQRNGTDPSLFLFSGEITRVEVQGDDRPITRPLTLDHVRYELARTAHWWAMRGPKDDKKRVTQMPPLAVCRDVMATPNHPLPVLERIIGCPSFTAAGSLQVTNGYNPDGRTFVAMPAGLVVPLVAGRPSRADQARARSLILDELLGDFLFTAASDRAHAVALGLEPFVRSMIRGPVPLHDIEAPTAGTGKGLLTHALLGPSAGAALSYMDAPEDEDEMRKRLLAALRTGPTAIVMDNLGAHLTSSSLSSVLTMPDYWEERILGSSSVVRVPVRCSWVLTANNPSFSEEMNRRVIRTRIDAGMDDPSERAGFRHDPLGDWVAAHRGELIWAYCTLVQAWIADGQVPSNLRMGSYEAWVAVIGGILEHAGIPGFLQDRKEFRDAASTERSALQEFVSAWWERYLDGEVGARDLFQIALGISGLSLGTGGEHAQQTAFGMFLTGHRDRVVGGYVIKRGGKKHNAQQWCLLPEGLAL